MTTDDKFLVNFRETSMKVIKSRKSRTRSDVTVLCSVSNTGKRASISYCRENIIFMARQPQWARAFSLLRFRDHTQKCHIR